MNYEERFWSKVLVGAGCWEWTAARIMGYGHFHMHGKPVQAHRWSYETYVGPIPDGMLVMHRCDNRSCVRPGHLMVGTHDDNMRDMTTKGRSAKGERVHGARLCELDVIEIRSRYPEHTMRQLSDRYGVTELTIRHVLRRNTWRHVA